MEQFTFLQNIAICNLFNNAAFNEAAFINIAGKTAGQIEINQTITNIAAKKGQYPMYRAIAISPTNAATNQQNTLNIC